MTRWGSIREGKPFPNGRWSAPAFGVLVLAVAVVLAVIA